MVSSLTFGQSDESLLIQFSTFCSDIFPPSLKMERFQNSIARLELTPYQKMLAQMR
jgi:hypothetical protein